MTHEERLLIGKALRKLRKEQNKKLTDFEKLGLSKSMVSRIENGKGVRENQIENFAMILGTTTCRILSTSENDTDMENTLEILRILEYKIDLQIGLNDSFEQLECLKKTSTYFLSWIYYLTGKIHVYEKRIRKAKKDFEVSIDLSRRLNTDDERMNTLSMCLHSLSLLQYQKNDVRTAIELNNEAIQCWDHEGTRQNYFADLLSSKIILYDKIGKIERARKEIIKLWDIRDEITNINNYIKIHEHFGKLLLHDHLYEEALDCLGHGITICLQNQKVENIIELVTIHASIEAKIGRLMQAKAKLNTALSFKSSTTNLPSFITILVELGKISMKENNLNEANHYFTEALSLSEQIKYTNCRYVEALITFADCFFYDQSMLYQSITLYEKAMELSNQQWLVKKEKKILLRLSACYDHANDSEKAVDCLKRYRELELKLDM
ncbi:Tetratricopeptide repeat-containing protein [Thermoactinomyces sp. DSM 45891]|uniref:helix-turn-helix domain-containing protein n=1 Tax=Thermoactinomyces sp. DSM 45891 TaxID=1761907 RepID=UPI00091EB014|nr:helix-turn-helix transcriptional regulator [Thermoactinomyces sp. DSM 45891]SFX26651.1 Tetratricopeptide repeat-containing protein [Thermoactinomyces sp. DSM 45891]